MDQDLLNDIKTFAALIVVFFLALIGYGVWSKYSWFNTVPTGYGLMSPAMKGTERYTLLKQVDRIGELDRGQIVQYRVGDARTPSFARVIAWEGEAVAIRDGKVHLRRKGEGGISPLNETWYSGVTSGYLPETQVPRGHLFLLVDQRHRGDRTGDSRSEGMIPEIAIEGAVQE